MSDLLRKAVIRLAHARPELRGDLLPLLKTAGRTATDAKAKAYVARIKNAAKKKYAQALVDFLEGKTNKEPERGSLSVMGGQAVRMELFDIYPERLLIQKGLLSE